MSYFLTYGTKNRHVMGNKITVIIINLTSAAHYSRATLLLVLAKNSAHIILSRFSLRSNLEILKVDGLLLLKLLQLLPSCLLSLGCCCCVLLLLVPLFPDAISIAAGSTISCCCFHCCLLCCCSTSHCQPSVVHCWLCTISSAASTGTPMAAAI